MLSPVLYREASEYMDRDFNQYYAGLRRRAIEKYFSRINPMQRQAVFQTRGPVLILAGAGSGKTTVIINRIANMVAFGHGHDSDFVPPYLTEEHADCLERYLAGEEVGIDLLRDCCAVDPVQPWRILAITFTNKAAGELQAAVWKPPSGTRQQDIQAATFHSACVRILRREITRVGYESNFTIYDTDDSLRLIKEACKTLRIWMRRTSPPSHARTQISRAKDKLLNPARMLGSRGRGQLPPMRWCARVYEEYQKQLRSANAVDFDDIILLTVRLFEENPDVLEIVPEPVPLYHGGRVPGHQPCPVPSGEPAGGEYRNLCVVGDDDQSIYKFRGATIENILEL